MGTEVVRPHDCLLRRTRNPSSRRVVGRRNDSMKEAKPRKREATLAGFRSECVSGRMARDGAALREVRAKTFSTTPRDVYAGSACALSPSPRALPLPRFSRRKEESPAGATSVDPFATRDLRRLLRLE
ncbi:uncharacterized protein LOC122034027 [Zingiber officinale]|uniref:uncharacterized protein LOC122034027 n=1 Tax=Zingiber officinale TaxID=94328 RepID=UPI001C4C742B|nr:uncharacterized protein LOC122034027 [Zingiber officinale]